MEYNRVFHKQPSINPGLLWNTVDSGLQAANIFGKQTSGTFCAICWESDHTALSPWSSSSNQCHPLPSISLHSIGLQGTLRHFSLFEWHRTGESASGQPACFSTCVRHARHCTGPETAQIPQEILTMNWWSTAPHPVLPIAHLLPDNRAQM